MIEVEELNGYISSGNIILGNLAEKGDPGKNSFLHIKYSFKEPTQDSDMSDTINNWIGIYVDDIEESSNEFQKYYWFKIKGEQGPRGETGVSIVSITKISKIGRINTYRITMSNSEYFDFEVADGDGDYNVIEKIKLNGVEIPITDKTVNVELVTTDNNFSNAYKSKLDGIENGAQKNLTETHTTLTTTTPIAENTNYTIPAYYKVGSNTLDIYYMGEKLVKNEHYIEVGESGAVSNIIQFKDWGQSVPKDRIIEFVVKGEYSSES